MLKRKNIYLFVGIMIIAICALLSNIFTNQVIYDIIAFLTIACGTLYIFQDVIKRSRFEAVSVLLAYAIRVILVVSAVYYTGLNIFIKSPDAESFFKLSQAYFIGNFEIRLTRYPYVLNFFYHIFGPDRIVSQYINVFCWYLCWKIICKMIDECSTKHQKIMTIVFCFIPESILMTSELLRESIMTLFIMLSFYYIWKWMDSGRIWNIIIAFWISFPAILLHSVSVVLWAGIFFAYIFWNSRIQRWILVRKKILIMLIGVVAIFLFFHYRLYSMLGYFPSELSLETITNRTFDKGRSDYLVGINVTNIVQFVFWTIIRGFYFWFSPIIFDWNSIRDVTGVVVDVIPLAYVLIITCIKKPHEYVNRQYIAGIIILLFYTFVYAWGVGNAGTAMRHRNMLLGLIIMTYGIRYKRQVRLRNSLVEEDL